MMSSFFCGWYFVIKCFFISDKCLCQALNAWIIMNSKPGSESFREEPKHTKSLAPPKKICLPKMFVSEPVAALAYIFLLFLSHTEAVYTFEPLP